MKNRPLVLGLGLTVLFGAVYYLYFAQGSAIDHNSGKPLAEVVVPEISGAMKIGETLFNANCASCHGKNAAGIDGVAPPLVHVIYEPNHHGDEAFQIAAQNGVRAHHWPFGDMKPVKKVSRDDVSKIIAYVRTLQRANGIH